MEKFELHDAHVKKFEIEKLDKQINSLQDGEIDLNFLQQKSSKDYSALIHEAESKVFSSAEALRANYDSKWQPYDQLSGYENERIENVTRALDRAMPKAVLVNLGGGMEPELIARGREAALYIDVNRYPSGPNDPTPPDAEHGSFRKSDTSYDLITGDKVTEGPLSKTLNVVFVQADMLEFTSRLKDKSVNISINGIDGDVISVREYHKALATEIVRVTKENGLIFGNNSFPVLRDVLTIINGDESLKKEFDIVHQEGAMVVIRRK